MANNITLDTFIKYKRLKAAPYSIISLDLRKVFDSVSHHAIKRALNRLLIDYRLIDANMSSFNNVATTLSINNNSIGVVQLNRGVKQGDPLSPFLFNVVMDEIIFEINKLASSQPFKICMAYADDLVLLNDSVKEGNISLNKYVSLLSRRHLTINAAKCNAITTERAPRKKKLYYHTTAQSVVNTCPIQQMTAGAMMKYLGLKYSITGIESISR